MMISLSRNDKATILSATAALLLLVSSGCFSPATTKDWAEVFEKAKKAEPAPKGTPKFDIVGQSLGESQEVSLTTGELATRVSELATAHRTVAASRWIQRHPEAALEWLRSGSASQNGQAMSLLAEVHDRQCSSSGPPQNWTTLDAARKRNPVPYQTYLEARNRFKNSLTQGQIDNALNQHLLKLAVDCESQLLEIDAWQLQGTAQLLNDKPREAAAAFEKAVAAALQVSTYQSAYLLLLLSDSQRRAGDPALAAATWQRAVVVASQLLASDHPIHDPVLWERLGYQRPVESPWPNDVVKKLQLMEPLPGTEVSGVDLNATASDAGADPSVAETAVWNAIGIWYLDRTHGQAALVSFKRAEASSRDEDARTWLRIRQARSLIQLQQDGAATAILVRIAGQKTTPPARAALGLLGSLRLKSGQVQQGLGLLRKSVETVDGLEWPERADAEADLGLAYLMMGDVQQGLQRLHAAQERFESEGNWESLTLALANEAAFFEETKKKKEAAAIRFRLESLERS
ncbi:MAG: hypothetical protein K8U03_25655 [Planctomycetia bacterium]|nr:hypothetical protein [Planctomycetia bacterium]